MRGLSLDQLQSFLDVVETGSFSAAAERRALSQPAISQQIRELEKRLGVRLIERLGRKAAPTAAGSELILHARRVEGSVTELLATMARHGSGEVGRIRLGIGATACIYLLPPILRQLRQQMPGLEIVVATGNTGDIVRQVEDTALDIALVTLPASGRMLDVTPVRLDEFVAVGPANGHLPMAVAPADLAGLPLVLYEPGGNTRSVIDDWFAKAGHAPRPVMELGSVEAIKELVGAGLGYTILPAMAVKSAPSLDVRPLLPALHRTLALVLRKDKQVTKALRALMVGLSG
ncbi:LysR family transcriptional regulator [Lacibacterium aquatile]|uniref:LysR family transcriptional regulator n=1 Tax=Lacibacterium aquatile TaxID=1168082 RepID=A0ABW5DKV0_9PROT